MRIGNTFHALNDLQMGVLIYGVGIIGLWDGEIHIFNYWGMGIWNTVVPLYKDHPFGT